MNATGFLLPHEIQTVLADLKRRCKRSVNSRRNRIIFRLSCCCGLRRMEISGLNMKDVLTKGPRPSILVKREFTRRKRKNRQVPLWWDSGTLADMAEWKAERQAMGAKPEDPLICGVSTPGNGKRLSPKVISRCWDAAIRPLGKERIRQVSIHKGRHTYVSLLVAAGVPLPVVRDVVGHKTITITDIYLHALPVDHIRDVFGVKPNAKA